MKQSFRTLCSILCMVLGLSLSQVFGGEIQVAVATNFLATLQVIAKEFEQEMGHELLMSSGSSGKLYVQIHNGAPFDLFLSADARGPELLEQEGLAVKGSRFTYAVGRLTLWSPDPAFISSDGKTILSQGNFEYLAIANPKTAPYGRAAVETLKALKVWEQVEGRVVQGENIGQTFHFVFTRNAQLGFVALSQVLDPKINGSGSRWDVPANLHEPLRQQAVLLSRAQHNEAAQAFLAYIQRTKAREIMERFGYGFE